MALAAYVASSNWQFPLQDDPRGFVPAGHIIILDTGQAAAATAAGTISGAATLTGPQTTTLAAMQGQVLGNRAPLIQALGLT